MGRAMLEADFAAVNRFSIRSFGSFDGTAPRPEDGGGRTEFQYPLFRII